MPAPSKKAELKNIYLTPSIYACARSGPGSTDTFHIANLYEEGIRNKSLFEHNYLSHWTYNNIVKLVLSGWSGLSGSSNSYTLIMGVAEEFQKMPFITTWRSSISTKNYDEAPCT